MLSLSEAIACQDAVFVRSLELIEEEQENALLAWPVVLGLNDGVPLHVCSLVGHPQDEYPHKPKSEPWPGCSSLQIDWKRRVVDPTKGSV